MNVISIQAGTGAADAAVVERLKAHVEACAVPRDIHVHPDSNKRIRDWLSDAFGELGYRITLQGKYENVVALPVDHDDVLIVGRVFAGNEAEHDKEARTEEQEMKQRFSQEFFHRRCGSKKGRHRMMAAY